VSAAKDSGYTFCEEIRGAETPLVGDESALGNDDDKTGRNTSRTPETGIDVAAAGRRANEVAVASRNRKRGTRGGKGTRKRQRNKEPLQSKYP